MNIILEKNVGNLTEWSLLDAGNFVEFVEVSPRYSKAIFENKTVEFFVEEDDHSEGELVANISVEETVTAKPCSNLSLSCVDVSTHSALILLSNGKKLGIEIQYSDDNYIESDYTILIHK